jgi:DNA repair protein RadC
MKKKDLIEQLSVMERENPTRRITFPGDAFPMLMKHGRRTQESFWVITLNGAHEVIRKREVTKGLLNRTVVHPREVFRGAIMDNAAAVILAHNHPSGSVTPSHEDRDITKRLKQAGEVIGIRVLDHLVFSREAYYSFLEHGEL